MKSLRQLSLPVLAVAALAVHTQEHAGGHADSISARPALRRICLQERRDSDAQRPDRLRQYSMTERKGERGARRRRGFPGACLYPRTEPRILAHRCCHRPRRDDRSPRGGCSRRYSPARYPPKPVRVCAAGVPVHHHYPVLRGQGARTG